MVNTKLETLNLLDKFLFDEAMEDRDTCQAVIGILLENEVELLGKAEIAPFDIFGRGLYRYTFEGVCRECPDLRLDDGAIRVFINTKGKNKEDFSREFLEFMEYIGKTTDETAERATSGRIRQIHERVCLIRKSEKAGVRYLQRWEELAYAREDGKTEGRIEGRTEGRTEGDLRRVISQVCKKVRKNKTVEEIAEDLEEEISVIEPIYNAAKESAPGYDPELVFQRISAGKIPE